MKGITSKNTHRKSAVVKVTEYIKEKIIYRELKAGDKIPTENELCQFLNVSRSSVREALKILEANSIIKIRRGDGTYISHVEDIRPMDSMLFKIILGDTSVSELISFREEIEFSVMKMAADNATPEDIRALKNNIEETKYCVENMPNNYLKLYDLDNEFHKLFGKATHNIIMEEVYNFTHGIISPMLLRNYKEMQGGEPTIESHEISVYAVENKDFYMMGHAVKKTIEIWINSYYGQKGKGCLLDKDTLNKTL